MKTQECGVSLSGDLPQLGAMENKLRLAGFRVQRVGVYPILAADEADAGLRYLFDKRIDGWWNQEHELVQRGILTQRAFDMALGRVPREGDIVVIESLAPGAAERKLTHNQARMLMVRGRIKLIRHTDKVAVFVLKEGSTWDHVNDACMTFQVWSKGEWHVSYGELMTAGEIVVYAVNGEGDDATTRFVGVTCSDADTSVQHNSENGYHPGIEECVANAELMRHAPQMLYALMLVVADPKIRASLDRMALEQIEGVINSALDGVAGPVPFLAAAE